ncbi:Sensor protein QseC [Paraburkholderia domus]|jgi:two-component system, OmpR family, sensor histidine kinase QseC|uniref:histidine kinase n=1 Tax=Paraburkholderia domus TaxID=2793075 RepID=A0A9N8N3V7_9BURK|nr:ATP-binding protein [Paraburkholderia domus]MBK5054294.1 two-component sensor histidine kinase [Burkholderia sp. R-70006]MBK5064521.1 two-component sensor histidine kinase [Burkholderia sp. R-70199]MBK5091315.1 two-component sensor histidine kinase [Burkholderia sp. R-69927]MBK5125599.1 two-component sensor histidine kinase [Burkholderia sp. R-69980]MBK5168493.1 two-component sensor histidine kinase [Burkholderia sp. R-70211]MBK5183690.1 two-component sensor histidine kinase [Burkholderia 
MSASIRRRLMLLVLTSIVLIWGIALISSYRQATREVGEWEEARLAELTQILAQLDQRNLTTLANARIDVREEEKGGEPGANDSDDDDSLPRDALFQVRSANGDVLAGSPQLHTLKAWDLPVPSTSGSQDIMLGGQLWHSFTLRDTSPGHTVRVFEPANTRSDLVSGVASRIARPTLVALPVLALLVWFSIGWSLAPLKVLSGAIRGRDINRLEPVDIGHAPTEVRPLVDAINLVLSRLRNSIERERAFTADAAHELKTPLAAIKVQAQVALAEPDTALQRIAMERVVQGVDRSARLAEQLLLLARLDVHERLSSAPLKPAAVAKDALLANERNAQQKNIHVKLTGDMRAEINAEPVLIGILLDNLLDNAIKYGHAGGRIEVAVQREFGRVQLTVRDDGPGVAPSDLARLTNRFFRATGNHATGSGLGLSIVARIAEHFGANLRLGTGIGEQGLAVEVSFPAYSEAE